MRIVRIIQVIAVLLILFQLIGYLGTLLGTDTDKVKGPTLIIDRIAYFIGFNMFLILGLVLLLIAASIKRRVKKKEMEAIIDSIGKQEE